MSAYQDLIKRWLGTFLGMLGNARRTPATVGRWREGQQRCIPHARSAAYSTDVTRISATGGQTEEGALDY